MKQGSGWHCKHDLPLPSTIDMMITTTPFHLPILTPWQKARLLTYAKQALIAQQAMTTPKGKGILHYTLQKSRRPIHMNHYPKGDRINHQTGAQYFYHCHRENLISTEHGHFHCFLRYKHIPSRIKPTPLADWDKYIDNPMTHLVAIALNQCGQPIRLFTVNRWITSEIWYDAKHVPTFINRFNMKGLNDPYWQPLDQWVEAILHLFLPQITWLHQQRDIVMANHKRNNPEDHPYNDHAIEELSEIHINLQQQIQWILTSEQPVPCVPLPEMA